MYSEFKELFPHNRVEYFVSYLDYYQPEAYLPKTDTYIDKNTKTNEELDMLRMAAVNSVLERRDTIIVASVASIYGASNPEQYRHMIFTLRSGQIFERNELMLALVLFFPVSLVLICGIIFVKAVSPEASPIFKQERVGYKNKLFALYKLRSMTNERDENGELLPDEVRLKNWGKIVRKTNMDELFQIWNILKGEMSFIGPRPILAKEMLVMTVAEQQERQSMRPGITGWEAVHEGESENRRQMAEYDHFYVCFWN